MRSEQVQKMTGREDRRVEARRDVVDQETRHVLRIEATRVRSREQSRRPATRREPRPVDAGRIVDHLEDRGQPRLGAGVVRA